MKLYMIRHGQSEANAHRDYSIKDPLLTNIGWSQALETGYYLREILEDIDCMLMSSPYRRTLQTASEISRLANLPIIVEKDLFEFNGMQDPDQPLMGSKDMAVLFPTISEISDDIGMDSWDSSPGETRRDFEVRVTRMMDMLMGYAQSIDEIVVVSHGSFIRKMIEIVVDSNGERPARPSNCSITVFDVDNEFGFDLMVESSVEHLAPSIVTD